MRFPSVPTERHGRGDNHKEGQVMTERILGEAGPKRSRRFRFVFLPIILGAALALMMAGGAQAVHDAGLFELDGNAVNGAATGDDWDNVCHQVTITDDTTNAIPNQCTSASDTTAATAVSWTAELNTNASIFTGGGSKDPEDISAWAWKDAGGLPDKDNLLHSFAARYQTAASATCPSTTATCDVLYFGSDRFDNSGDAQQGFWFFQNKITLSNVKSGGGFKFDGVHETGDLLVISDFSNGGTTSTISVYTWDPTVSGNLKLEASSAVAKCSAALGTGDSFCGIVNEATTLTTSPWTFLDKSGNTNFAQGEFYEGGVNLSALGLGDECFSSVASESRSSTSTTATLKDFVLGQLGNCSATLTTQVSNAGPVTPGTAITDVATVTGTSPTNDPVGDVTFFLCSGVAAGGSCPTGGTNLGTGTLTGNSDGTSTATSPSVNGTGSELTPGHYCFRAEWPGDTNYTTALSETNSTTECFDVKATSSISTSQSWLPQDSATVTVNGAAVAGTVVFRLYPNGTCSGTTFVEFTDTAAPYETNNTTYRTASTIISWSATFTPSDPNAVQGSTTTRCERSDLTINNSASDFPPAP
jgi:hypothetical protein